MSLRNFTRVFTAQLGRPRPATSTTCGWRPPAGCWRPPAPTVDVVARRCGFGTAETLRRSFLRTLGVPPTDYRRRFAPAG